MLHVHRAGDRKQTGRAEAPPHPTVAAIYADLSRDPRTAQAIIEVGYARGLGGCIIVRGEVRTAVEKHAALEVARRAAGAAVVIDQIDVRSTAARKNHAASTLSGLWSSAHRAPIARRMP